MLLNRQTDLGLIIGLLPVKYENSLVENKNSNLTEDKTMTKKADAKIMELEQLEKVSGGTVKEFGELLDALEQSDFVNGLATHVPLYNNLTAADMEDILQAYNVDADISLGFVGLGICSDPNVYKDSVTGETLTHEQVLNRLRRVIHYN